MSGSGLANSIQRFVCGEMNDLQRIVVVGASQAGLACAAALRGGGFDGDITMVGDERHRPYTRPPLSKGILVGEEPEDSVFLDGTGDDVTLRTSTSAAGLDCSGKFVALADGERIPYDGLVIATGARARRLSGADPCGEITLRTLDDAVAVRDRLACARDVAIIGGGFLGMEIASAAAKLGKSVTVVDQMRPLASHLGTLFSDLCVTAAAERGVKVMVGNERVKLGFDGEFPRRVLTIDDTVLVDADVAITAAGDVPNTEWLHGSGLPLERGVVVDRSCRVAPGIVAAGDVVAAPAGSGLIRRPHWWNALTQAKIAASTLLGDDAASGTNTAIPFFWTEVFGLNIRVAGNLPPLGEPTVLEGSISDRRGLFVWPAHEAGFGTAVSLNFPISVAKLARLANQKQTN